MCRDGYFCLLSCQTRMPQKLVQILFCEQPDVVHKNRWPFPYSSVLATIQLHLVHRVYSKFMLAWVFVRTTVCLSMRCCLMYAGTASLVCGIKRPEYETILPRKRYPNHTNNILFSKHNKSSKKPKPWLKFYPPKLYGSHFVIIFP